MRGDTLRDDKREGANNIGVFLQHELELGDRLNLTLGARYDAIRYYYDSHIDPTLDATKAFAHVSPKLGASYRFSSSHSVYLNVGGGVQAPAATRPTLPAPSARTRLPRSTPCSTRSPRRPTNSGPSTGCMSGSGAWSGASATMPRSTSRR